MTSRWPTDPDEDGSAPPSLALVTGGDEHLRRQALYQVQAASQLQDRGYVPAAFQVPVIGRMARITIPIAVTTASDAKAAVYTQSEEWTRERVADLRGWIASFREESDTPVIVASRVAPPPAAAVPEVAEFLHLPYDTLNAGAESAPEEPAAMLLPCLKERKWRGREQTVCRALWEKDVSAGMPWLAVGYDHPHTFEFINTERLVELNTTESALEAQALLNLSKRQATWQPLDADINGGKRLHMLLCTDDFYAAERIVDPDFMREAQRRLNARGLLVGVPRRGVLMATNGEQDDQILSAFGAAVVGQFSRGETALISPILFGLKDGAIVGIVEAVADALLPDGEPYGAGGGEEQDDADAPYVSVVVTRNDRGSEDVRLLAGGQDGVRLAKAIESAFMQLLKGHGPRKEFSGHFQIVVLGMTPPPARKHIPSVLEHLRGICSELPIGDRQCRVSLTYQRDAFGGDSEPARAAASAKSAATPTRAAGSGRSSGGWGRLVLVLLLGLIALSRLFT